MTTASNTANRDRVARIIRELQQRTVSNGCTEAEAMAAAKKLNELMAEHDMSMDEASVEGDTYGARKRPYATGVNASTWHQAVKSTVGTIARFCNTKCLLMNNGDLMFFGTAQDTEMAFYLTDLVRNAGEAAWQAEVKRMYQLKRAGNPDSMSARTVRASWFIGFAARVNERLREMIDQRAVQAQQDNTTTAIVLVKRNVVVERYHKWVAQQGFRVGKARTSRNVTNATAYNNGRAAGNNVSFNRPVGGATSSRRIG